MLPFLAVFISEPVVAGSEPEALAIINGEDVEDASTYPYIASLQVVTEDGNEHNCGGSIISDEYILSAAHCFFDEDGNQVADNYYNVMVGVVDLTEQGGEAGNRQLMEAKQVIVHPDYDGNVDNDIAIIQLNGNLDLDGTYVAAISLATNTQNLTSGQDLTVIGWGDTIGSSDEYEYGEYPDRLQVATVDFITQSECLKMIGEFDIHGRMCAGTGDTDSCSGDSGGPLVADGVQYGIVSYGVSTGCGKGIPGIYAEVSCYLGWVGETTGLDVGRSTCGDGSSRDDGVMDEDTLYLLLGIGIGTIFLILAIYSCWRVYKARKEEAQTGPAETPRAKYGAV